MDAAALEEAVSVTTPTRLMAEALLARDLARVRATLPLFRGWVMSNPNLGGSLRLVVMACLYPYLAGPPERVPVLDDRHVTGLEQIRKLLSVGEK